MRKSLMILVLVLVACSVGADEPKNQKPSTFEVTFTLKYNSLTLEEAAKKEMEIRKLFGAEVCSINLHASPSQGFIVTGSVLH